MPDKSGEAGRRCYYYADDSDYRCERKVGHDGPHRHRKIGPAIGHTLTDFSCRCPVCEPVLEAARKARGALAQAEEVSK